MINYKALAMGTSPLIIFLQLSFPPGVVGVEEVEGALEGGEEEDQGSLGGY